MPTRRSGEESPLPPTFDLADLGARLKATRLAKHLPMRSVARIAGISVTHISQIERGRNCPTIGALARIAAALGVSLHYFLEPEPRPEIQHSLRTGQPGTHASLGDPEFRGSWISDGICGGRVQVVRVRVEPHSPANPGEHLPIPVMQLIHILTGRLYLSTGDELLEYAAGDALAIQPKVASKLINPGPGPCEYILVVRNEQARWSVGSTETAASRLDAPA
jgi:transcriptional regulator with XRE-family HTH domain